MHTAGQTGQEDRATFASSWARTLPLREPFRHMPSLFRFLIVAAVLAAVFFGGLYLLSIFLEPDQREMSTSVPGVKVRR